jgi:hypothetical protein
MSKVACVLVSCGISVIVALVATLLAGCQLGPKQTVVQDSTGGNPFSPPTNFSIEYVLTEADSVLVVIYSVNGKVVDTVINGFEQPGEKIVPILSTKLHSLEWPSGIYFYSVTTGDSTYTKKLVWLR